MECKFVRTVSGLCSRKELIDTLWNVNAAPVSASVRASGINRYIMEGKYRQYAQIRRILRELIDTLWNVNNVSAGTNTNFCPN